MLIHQKSFVVKYLFPFSPNIEQQNILQTKSPYKLSNHLQNQNKYAK